MTHSGPPAGFGSALTAGSRPLSISSDTTGPGWRAITLPITSHSDFPRFLGGFHAFDGCTSFLPDRGAVRGFMDNSSDTSRRQASSADTVSPPGSIATVAKTVLSPGVTSG